MSDWSSYKDQQLLTESWRKYLGNWRGGDVSDAPEEEKPGKGTLTRAGLMPVIHYIIKAARLNAKTEPNRAQFVTAFEKMITDAGHEIIQEQEDGYLTGIEGGVQFNPPKIVQQAIAMAFANDGKAATVRRGLVQAGFSDESVETALEAIQAAAAQQVAQQADDQQAAQQAAQQANDRQADTDDNEEEIPGNVIVIDFEEVYKKLKKKHPDVHVFQAEQIFKKIADLNDNKEKYRFVMQKASVAEAVEYSDLRDKVPNMTTDDTIKKVISVLIGHIKTLEPSFGAESFFLEMPDATPPETTTSPDTAPTTSVEVEEEPLPPLELPPRSEEPGATAEPSDELGDEDDPTEEIRVVDVSWGDIKEELPDNFDVKKAGKSLRMIEGGQKRDGTTYLNFERAYLPEHINESVDIESILDNWNRKQASSGNAQDIEIDDIVVVIDAISKAYDIEPSEFVIGMPSKQDSKSLFDTIVDFGTAANLIPGGQLVSTPANIISFGRNIYRKRYGEALLNLVGLIPVAGATSKVPQASRAVSAALKAAKAADDAHSAATVKEAFGELFKAFGDKSADVNKFIHGAISHAVHNKYITPDAGRKLRRHLPSETSTQTAIQENKQLDRWKLLAGIK